MIVTSSGGRACMAALLALVQLVAACGGGPEPAGPESVVDPPLPEGASRWAALEFDRDADGTVDEITLYRYDAADRRSVQLTYAALAGVPAGDPLRETHWTYDARGRMSGIRVRDAAAGRETTTSFGYGSDGTLDSRRETATPAGTVRDTQYSWRDGRLAEAVASGGSGPGRWLVEYGSDGFVSRVLVLGNGFDNEEDYRWRPDGGLLSAVFLLDVSYGGASFSYDLEYDAAGRLLTTRGQDDGLEVSQTRLSHDAQGRLTEVAQDNQPSAGPGGSFVARRIWRYRWETARCQPVPVHGLPPHREQLEAGLISPANTSFGCGP